MSLLLTTRASWAQWVSRRTFPSVAKQELLFTGHMGLTMYLGASSLLMQIISKQSIIGKEESFIHPLASRGWAGRRGAGCIA